MKHLFKTTTFNVVKTRLTGQPFFYTSIFSLIALGLIIGNFVFGWIPPTATPPSSNLPAPINVSSTEQTKAGNLIIGGVLRLGQFTTAPSGTEGALYYNTTEKKAKVFSNAAWGDLGGGALGLLPSYTTTQRNALSPTTGQQIYNTTENKVQVYGSGNWIAVSAKLALAATCTLDGDCDSTHCVDSVCCDTVCTGTICQTCGSLSSAGIGYCGYVNNSSNDPRNTCTTASPGAADSCKSPNCNGTGYACGYLSGEASQPVCKTCTGSSYNPSNIATGSQDAEGPSYLCTATHYRCDGAGACTAPTYISCLYTYAESGLHFYMSGDTYCTTHDNGASCVSCRQNGNTGCVSTPDITCADTVYKYRECKCNIYNY
jgi:hypothetical protein